MALITAAGSTYSPRPLDALATHSIEDNPVGSIVALFDHIDDADLEIANSRAPL